MSSAWTTAELDYIRQKMADGWTAKRVAQGLAEEFGRQVDAIIVYAIARSRGLGTWLNQINKEPQWVGERLAILQKLAAQGYSASVIADAINATLHLNVSRNAVVGVATRLGIPLTQQITRHQVVGRKKAATLKVAPAAPTIACDPIPLIDLKPNSCRWPLERDEFGRRLFCGAKQLIAPYCLHHTQLSLRSPNERRTTRHGTQEVRYS